MKNVQSNLKMMFLTSMLSAIGVSGYAQWLNPTGSKIYNDPLTANVGIGVTNPTYKLQVENGNTLLNGDLSLGIRPYAYVGTRLYVDGHTIVNGRFSVGTTTATFPGIDMYVQGTTILTGNVGIGTSSMPTQNLQVGGNTILEGNVGIGITNLQEKLQVYGGALKIGNTNSLADRQTNVLKFGDGNYVRIGEWETDNMLSVYAEKGFSFKGGIDADAYFGNHLRIGGGHFIFAGGSSGVINFGSSANKGDLYFRSLTQAGNIMSYNHLMILTYNGTLGINTSTPSTTEKLHVNGSVRIGEGTAGAHNNMLKFGDGDYTKIGEWEADDRLSFYARLYYNFTGGNVGMGLASNVNPAYRLDVNGYVRAANVSVSSDERLKSNISALSDEKDKLYLLQGKSYKKTLFPTNLEEFAKDTTSEQLKQKEAIPMQQTEFSEYGYLAQEFKKIFPDLVSEDNEGYYSINYIGLIPIIVEALKDQKQTIETQQEDNTQQQKEIKVLQDIVFSQEKDLNRMQNVIDKMQEVIDEMQKVVAKCCENTGAIQQQNNPPSAPNNNQNTIQEEAVLYQNIPNPFSANTEISCEIPTKFTSAFIYVYNMQGVELMSFPVAQTGYSTVTVYASALPAGMYLYTLVVNNQIIDTKRMILTK